MALKLTEQGANDRIHSLIHWVLRVYSSLALTPTIIHLLRCKLWLFIVRYRHKARDAAAVYGVIVLLNSTNLISIFFYLFNAIIHSLNATTNYANIGEYSDSSQCLVQVFVRAYRMTLACSANWTWKLGDGQSEGNTRTLNALFKVFTHFVFNNHIKLALNAAWIGTASWILI